MLVFDLFEKFSNKFRLIKREKTNNVIIFVYIIIKIKYNVKYLAFTL